MGGWRGRRGITPLSTGLGQCGSPGASGDGAWLPSKVRPNHQRDGPEERGIWPGQTGPYKCCHPGVLTHLLVYRLILGAVLDDLPRLGRVKVLTRRDSSVHARQGGDQVGRGNLSPINRYT